MPRGKAKGRWDFKAKYCTYEFNTWCNLPKYKRCEHCIRCKGSSNACGITALVDMEE